MNRREINGLEKKSRWLAYCVEIGFKKSDVPELEKIWDKYKDKYGELKKLNSEQGVQGCDTSKADSRTTDGKQKNH